MMELWVVLFVVFGAFFLLIVQFSYSNRMRKGRWRERFQREWGTIPDREYDYTELDKISRYFYYNLKKGRIPEPYIDDITWNDLDMDSIYAYVNHTRSSPGEEYQYYL